MGLAGFNRMRKQIAKKLADEKVELVAEVKKEVKELKTSKGKV